MTTVDLVTLLDPLLVRLADLLAERLKANGNGHAPPEAPDKLLTAQQAAARIGMTVRWLYGHASTLPFAVRLPNSRAIRFSERGLAKWLARRMG